METKIQLFIQEEMAVRILTEECVLMKQNVQVVHQKNK